MSVHLSQRAYLKCFKRLLSVLFVITGWTTFSGTYTLADTQAGCGHTHLLTRTPKSACKSLYMHVCMLSLFLSLTHTYTQIHTISGEAWERRNIRKHVKKNEYLLFDNATHDKNEKHLNNSQLYYVASPLQRCSCIINWFRCVVQPWPGLLNILGFGPVA